jgi:UrcA family protein
MKAIGIAAAARMRDIAAAAARTGDFEYFPCYSIKIEYGDLDLARPDDRRALSARIEAALGGAEAAHG